MNEIVSMFLLAGYKFMHEMHLKQPGFNYSACGPFTENKKRIQKFILNDSERKPIKIWVNQGSEFYNKSF